MYSMSKNKRGRPKIGKDRVVFTLSPEMKTHLEKMSANENVTMAEYLRRLIEADMARPRSEP